MIAPMKIDPTLKLPYTYQQFLNYPDRKKISTFVKEHLLLQLQWAHKSYSEKVRLQSTLSRTQIEAMQKETLRDFELSVHAVAQLIQGNSLLSA